jgi:phosphate:Na+ symporter
MLSSTAAIAVTLSAYYAGAIEWTGLRPDHRRNIGTATSPEMAAIGASTTAKRLRVVYSLFKVIAVLIAMVSFLYGARRRGFCAAYNVVGVLVLVPVIG